MSERKKKSLEDNLLLDFAIDYSEPLDKNTNTLSLESLEVIHNRFSGYNKRFIYLAAVFYNSETSKLKRPSTVCIQYPPSV